MTHVGIVGAGAAAAGLCTALERERPAADVTVLEAAATVGGRAATRTHADCTYDYGANYLTDDDERVATLVRDVAADGLVDVDGPVFTFDREGAVSEGRDEDESKWTHEAGVAELPRRLLAATDASVQCGTRVATLRRAATSAAGGRWLLVDADGREWGPFDAVALTPPAPRTAELLRGADPFRDADLDDGAASDGGESGDGTATDPDSESPLASAVAALADAAAAVPYRSIYSAVCGYEFEIERPYYALVNADREHEVGWIAREECKPGHVPDGQSLLVVQASPAWTDANARARDEAKQRELAALAAAVVGDERLAEPAWTDGHGWTAALPDEAVAAEAVEAAREHGLFCAGDWVAGEARLHAAVRSGLEAGEAIADEV